MKYCPDCKVRAPKDAEACPQCGKPIRMLGVPARGTTPASSRPAAASSETASTSSGSSGTRGDRRNGTPAGATATLADPATDTTTGRETGPGKPHHELPAAKEDAPPRENVDLQLQLDGLSHDIEQSKQRMRRLSWIAALLAALLLMFLAYLWFSRVFSFARVDDLAITPSEKWAGTVVVTYRPRTAGKIEFVRHTDDRAETLVEHVERPPRDDEEPLRFQWAASGDDRYTVRVRYRAGWWSLADEEFDSRDAKSKSADDE